MSQMTIHTAVLRDPTTQKTAFAFNITHLKLQTSFLLVGYSRLAPNINLGKYHFLLSILTRSPSDLDVDLAEEPREHKDSRQPGEEHEGLPKPLETVEMV